MASHGRLVGKLAIVTGGGSGIGRAICHRFAVEGAHIAVVDTNDKHCDETVEALSNIHSNKHIGYHTNVSDSAEVKELFHKIQSDMGMKSNLLVNAAGIIRDNFLIKIPEADFDEVINVNLKSVHLMTQAFIGNLNISGKYQPGNVINISSIIGKSGNIGQSNYAASKAGVIGFTKSVAYEYGREGTGICKAVFFLTNLESLLKSIASDCLLATFSVCPSFHRFGIRTNAILPGFIKTPMTASVPEQLLMRTEKQIPLKRLGNPEEVANACLFLASDESSYVNGACLEVTGGLLA